jgi:hypothetical protein
MVVKSCRSVNNKTGNISSAMISYLTLVTDVDRCKRSVYLKIMFLIKVLKKNTYDQVEEIFQVDLLVLFDLILLQVQLNLDSLSKNKIFCWSDEDISNLFSFHNTQYNNNRKIT